MPGQSFCYGNTIELIFVASDLVELQVSSNSWLLARSEKLFRGNFALIITVNFIFALHAQSQ